MKTLPHLRLQGIKLPPGQEWSDSAGAWRFLRVASGAAYWLGPPRARSLAEGELLVVSPTIPTLVLASQLNEVALNGFSFSPGLLGGLLNLSERSFFDTCASRAPSIQFLPSTHPAAERFAALVTAGSHSTGLFQSAEALGIVAAVFDENIGHRHPPPGLDPSASRRFDQLVAHMPDAELINHPPAHLARLCGCSARHFNRLFRKHFGSSVRARQTELRLLHARELLGGTGERIVEVALKSGYRNLGLFNSLFKRRFGLTPSEWRRQGSKTSALG